MEGEYPSESGAVAEAKITLKRNIMNKKLLFLLSLMAVSCTVNDVEICKFKDGRQAALSLTFDDGLAEHYTLVLPQLERHALPATFWINANNIGGSDEYSPRLTWDNCREMAAMGHEISNHSWSHKNLTRLSEEEIREEIRLNDEAIERELGVRPLTFCYPFNAFNEQVEAIASEGRVGTRTFQEAQGQVNSHSTKESLEEWLDDIVARSEWGVTMTHGIRTAWDQWEDPNVLWNYFKYISAKRHSLWVGTFAQVASYIAERDNCTIKVRQCGNKVTITPECTLDPAIYKEPLTARVKDRYLEFDPFGGPQTFDLSDPLYGKVVNVIGDSYVRNHARPYSETWHSKVARRHHMVYNNYGINGSSIAFDRTKSGFGAAMVDRYGEMSEDADYIILIAGHNDASMLSFMPDSVDVFKERLDLLLKGIKQDYPGAKVGFVAPWQLDQQAFTDVIGYITEACEENSVKLIVAPQSLIDVNNEEFRAKYFQRRNDTAHLNDKGHDLLLDWGDEFLKSL